MVLSPLGSPKLLGFEGILEILRAGIENFPSRPNREVNKGKEKGPRKKASLLSALSQRVIIVCFEMGVPYFKVTQGARPEGPGDPPSERQGLGKEAGERIRGSGIALTLVSDGCSVGRCVGVSPAGQAESPVPELVSGSRRGPGRGPPSCGGSSPLGSGARMSGECREESEPDSQAKKGNLLEGKERVTGS